MTGIARDNESGDAAPSPADSGSPPGRGSPPEDGWRREYWRRNLRLKLVLLGIWFIVPFGGGILFVDQLNQLEINGFPLGFWIAQQGSIYTFVILILVYAVMMDRLDDRFGVSERDGDGERL